MVKVQFLSERVNSLSLLCREMSYLVSLFFQIQDPCHCGNDSFCSFHQNILLCFLGSFFTNLHRSQCEVLGCLFSEQFAFVTV